MARSLLGLRALRLVAVLGVGGLLLMAGAYEGWSFWKASERQTAVEGVARMMEKCGWGYDIARAESYVVQVHLKMGLGWIESAHLFRVSTSCGMESN
jgi:hypothetical protein